MISITHQKTDWLTDWQDITEILLENVSEKP
jgi:hypothetical protein